MFARIARAIIIASVWTATILNAPGGSIARAGDMPAQQISGRAVRNTHPAWTLALTDSPGMVGIYRDVAIVELYGSSRDGHTEVRTEGIDASTGRILWRQKNASLAFGTIPFLVFRTTVERIDARSGARAWRSAPLCKTRNATPTKVTALRDRIYVGCTSGEIFALESNTGRVLSSAYPIKVDGLDSIHSLAFDTLSVSGHANVGGDIVTRSAILKAGSLSTVLSLGDDVSYLAYDKGDVVAADRCCRGLREDNSPVTISRFSLRTGKRVASVDLHPYQPSLPPDKSLPGAGTVLLVGSKLYVCTHSALFLYDLRDLRARPRLLYGNLEGSPAPVIADRYFFLAEKAPAAKVGLFDAIAAPARLAWSGSSDWALQPWTPGLGNAVGLRSVNQGQMVLIHFDDMSLWRINDNCTLQSSNARFALTYCSAAGPPPMLPSRFQMYEFRWQ